MKKILLLLVMAVFTAASVSAQTKAEEKIAKKEAAKMAKDLEKEGWTLDGSGTLEGACYRHLIKKYSPKYGDECEKTGDSEGAVTLNQAKSVASINAAVEYARDAGMRIEGIFKNQSMVHNGTDTIVDQAVSYEKMLQAYRGKIQADIQGELEKSFGVYKKDMGKWTYKAFILVNRNAYAAAQKKAWQALQNEDENAKQFSDAVDALIDGSF